MRVVLRCWVGLGCVRDYQVRMPERMRRDRCGIDKGRIDKGGLDKGGLDTGVAFTEPATWDAGKDGTTTDYNSAEDPRDISDLT